MLECIRRFYAGEGSPLAECLGRYEEFFSLFGDFSGYVDFFFLQDLLDEDKVKFFTAFDGFGSNPLPKDAAEYYHLAEG